MVNPKVLASLEVEFVDFLTELRGEPRAQVKTRYLLARNGFKTWTRGFKDYHLGILRMNGVLWGFSKENDLASHYRQLEGYHALRFISYCHNKEYMGYVKTFPDKVLSALEMYPENILDYGCGMALMSTELAKEVKARGGSPTVWLYDFPGISRDFAVWRLNRAGIIARTWDINEDVLSIKGQDVCFVWSVFEHLIDPEKVAEDICNIINPNGILISYLGSWQPEPLHINFKQEVIKKIITSQFKDLGGWIYKKDGGKKEYGINEILIDPAMARGQENFSVTEGGF